MTKISLMEQFFIDVESIPGLLGFFFTSLCDWFGRLALPS